MFVIRTAEVAANTLSFPVVSVNITLLHASHVVGSMIHPDSRDFSSSDVSNIGECEVLLWWGSSSCPTGCSMSASTATLAWVEICVSLSLLLTHFPCWLGGTPAAITPLGPVRLTYFMDQSVWNINNQNKLGSIGLPRLSLLFFKCIYYLDSTCF